jgi:bifunctional non-homologous end joining protein LigD
MCQTSRSWNCQINGPLPVVESGEIGPELFRAACNMGLEGLVSKHRERAYRAGTSPNWVKVKNPKHPAMTRVMEAFANKV